MKRDIATDLIITELASGATVQAAAVRAGCSRRTVQRLKQSEEFQERIRGARTEILAKTSAKLARGSEHAVDCLVDLLDDPNSSARLGAARAILEYCFKARELLDFEDRLSKIEAALAETNI